MQCICERTKSYSDATNFLYSAMCTRFVADADVFRYLLEMMAITPPTVSFNKVLLCDKSHQTDAYCDRTSWIKSFTVHSREKVSSYPHNCSVQLVFLSGFWRTVRTQTVLAYQSRNSLIIMSWAVEINVFCMNYFLYKSAIASFQLHMFSVQLCCCAVNPLSVAQIREFAAELFAMVFYRTSSQDDYLDLVKDVTASTKSKVGALGAGFDYPDWLVDKRGFKSEVSHRCYFRQ